MKSVHQAIRILKKGGIVVFPTETAYGVGCRIDDEKAVRRLIKLRRRSKGKPFLVLVSSLQMAKRYWQKLPFEVENLAKKFWPGPLTIIYYCQEGLVSGAVRADGKTLGVRMPPYEITLKFIEAVGVPILAPSANFSGKETPYKFSDLDSEFLKSVDFVLKTSCGQYKKTSTVIDCTSKPWQVLREGAIKKQEIFC